MDKICIVFFFSFYLVSLLGRLFDSAVLLEASQVIPDALERVLKLPFVQLDNLQTDPLEERPGEFVISHLHLVDLHQLAHDLF